MAVVNSTEIIITIGLIVIGFFFMIARDYWNMRRATRKDKNSVEAYIRNLDLHDPTPYDKLIEKHDIPVGVDKDKAHLFDGNVKVLEGDKNE